MLSFPVLTRDISRYSRYIVEIFNYVKINNCLRNGVNSGNCGALRCVHGTAHLRSGDFYEVLGVTKNSSSSEIKESYYRLAKKFHPDTNRTDQNAEKKFQEVHEAYEVLKNLPKRSFYDQVGHEEFKSAEESCGPFEDMFSGGMDDIPLYFFGNGGPDVKISLKLSLLEALGGCTKILKFETAISCVTCAGRGYPARTHPEICKLCSGSGRTFVRYGPFKCPSTCRSCRGSGKSVSIYCKSCKGYCVVKGPKSVKMNLKQGVDNDEIMMVKGGGGTDPADVKHGDLYVTIKILEHPVFRREGSNIHVNVLLSVSQAAIGGTVKVPTLFGDDVVVLFKRGTRNGQKIRVKGKGVRDYEGHSSKVGCQIVHFIVTNASKLGGGQREFLKEDESGDREGIAVGASR